MKTELLKSVTLLFNLQGYTFRVTFNYAGKREKNDIHKSGGTVRHNPTISSSNSPQDTYQKPSRGYRVLQQQESVRNNMGNYALPRNLKAH